MTTFISNNLQLRPNDFELFHAVVMQMDLPVEEYTPEMLKDDMLMYLNTNAALLYGNLNVTYLILLLLYCVVTLLSDTGK